MLLTEEQARKKWCPVDTAASGDGVACTASSCMMWRWVREFDPAGGPAWSAEPGAINYTGPGGSTKTVRGYCGLAGKPVA